MDGIPTKINMYNAYSAADKLIGVSGEVKLPDFSAISETISGPGILGEIEDPAIGQYGSQEVEITFLTLTESVFKLFDPTTGVNITLRGSEQVSHPDGSVSYVGQRVVIRGRNKGMTGGTFQQGKPQNAAVKTEVTYLMIERDGKALLELDKFNSVFKVFGKDVLASAKGLC